MQDKNDVFIQRQLGLQITIVLKIDWTRVSRRGKKRE